MGREHRVQRNARVRQESDWRTTRISAFVPAECVRFVVPREVAIIGIDVGENFLDLAIIDAERRRLRYARVGLEEIRGANPIDLLAGALAQAVPELRGGAIAIVDSPRSALDLDCSNPEFIPRSNPPPTRAIDAQLRELVRRLNDNPARKNKLRLSLFPSRLAKYFIDCAFHRDCKLHLNAFGAHMFKGLARDTIVNPARLSGGALFTRFMISGFATYQALGRLGAETFEGYPYLAFRLCMKRGEPLSPKRNKSKALADRKKLLRRLAGIASVEMPSPSTLDQADAAILAMTLAASSRAGAIAQIVCPPEGRFIVALDDIDSDYFFINYVTRNRERQARLTSAEANRLKETDRTRESGDVLPNPGQLEDSLLASREFKAIFFDLDGTLVDIHGPLYSAARSALDELGHEPTLTQERYREALARDDVWLGVPDHIRPEYIKLAWAYFMAEIDKTERLEVLPHVSETLAELKRRGYATGVITSRPGNSQRLVEKLAMVGLASHLDHVVTQSTATMRALDKSASLKQTALKAATHPRACMYVGDEPRDIMAAINAGYGASVAVATGAASFNYLQNHPEYKPDHVIRSMGELIDLLDRLKEERVD